MVNQKNFTVIPSDLYPIQMSIHNKIFEIKLRIQKQDEYFNPNLLLDREAEFSVHQISTIPNLSFELQKAAVKFGYVMIADVTPEVIITDESLRRLSSNDRKCYFEDEKSLKYFNKYTEQHCLAECVVDVHFNRCGCIANMNIFVNKPGMKYCHTLKDIKCVYDRKVQVLLPEYNEKCACFPECNSVTYKVDYRGDFNEESENETVIIVRMKTEDAYLYRRYQQYTFSDVLSYVGGLLGLFAGISMLSVVEFFYFFTFRMTVNLWRSLRLEA